MRIGERWCGMRSFDYHRLGNCLWGGEVVSLLSQIHEYKGRQDLFVSL